MRNDLFAPEEQVTHGIDEYVRAFQELEPLPGFDRSHYPGEIEAERERRYRQQGVPVGSDHQRVFEQVAAELDLDLPW